MADFIGMRTQHSECMVLIRLCILVVGVGPEHGLNLFFGERLNGRFLELWNLDLLHWVRALKFIANPMEERTQANICVVNGFGRKPDIVIASNLLGAVLGLCCKGM